ncbi:hypothetical protein [Sphingomonas sp.]|uniref:hypothetical protein n=1 Tax=Sphingomonas sp. TaxID=28214 RepID=UPI0031D989DC
MQNWSTATRIVMATLVAGTLDILAAIGLTLAFGRKVEAMLRYVASGPFPDAKNWGATGAAAGLAVHFVLMAIMAAIFVLAADRMPQLKEKPILWGVIYGLVTYVAMNLVVVPLRFGTFPVSAMGIATQLFCHIVLVGIPIALIARR